MTTTLTQSILSQAAKRAQRLMDAAARERASYAIRIAMGQGEVAAQIAARIAQLERSAALSLAYVSQS